MKLLLYVMLGATAALLLIVVANAVGLEARKQADDRRWMQDQVEAAKAANRCQNGGGWAQLDRVGRYTGCLMPPGGKL